MKGYLIVNDSLNSEKYEQIKNSILREAALSGMELVVKTNAEMFFEKDFLPFAIFYDKDITLAKFLEDNGVRLFNSARAIELCDDKALTYLELKKRGVNQPKTFIAPLVWGNYRWENSPFIKNSLENLSFPIVVKERFGSFGAQVFLVNDFDELLHTVRSFNNRPFILQEFVKTSVGIDLRVEVIGKVAVASMLRQNLDDFRANLTNGGKSRMHELTEQEKSLSEQVARILGLDFCGVDLLFCNDGLSVCEVNSNAHFYNLSRTTGVNVAKTLVEHVRAELIREKR